MDRNSSPTDAPPGSACDPQGAALACHISTHIDPYTGPGCSLPTITEQVIGGKDLVERTEQQYRRARKTAGLAAAKAVERGDPVLAPTGEMTGWRIRDFRLQSVTTVELLVTTPQGQQVVYEVPVVWSDDDWRVSLSDSLSDALFASPLPTIPTLPNRSSTRGMTCQRGT